MDLSPAGLVRIETKDGQALEYPWNRGDGVGLQFEGDASFAMGKEGLKGVLNLKIFNVPRAQQGEMALKGAIVRVDLGYLESSVDPVFVGYLKQAMPSMSGGTSVWTIYATIYNKQASSLPLSWEPALLNSGATVQEAVSLGTILDHFAFLAGIQVQTADSVRETFIAPMSITNRTAEQFMNDVRLKMTTITGRAFILKGSTESAGIFSLEDPADGEGQRVLLIDPDQESVYDANFEVVQSDTESEADAKAATTGNAHTDDPVQREEESYRLYYKMELPIRADARIGTLIETVDPHSDVPVRFVVNSATFNFGSEWSMLVRGPVEGSADLLPKLPGVVF